MLRDYLQIEPGHRQDLKTLAHLHYIKEPIACPTLLNVITPKPQHAADFPALIAVLVHQAPLPQLRARNLATNNYFTHITDARERLRRITDKISYGSRLIVDPRFRRRGLATWLLSYTLDHIYHQLVEILLPYGWMVPTFQRLGFRLYQNPVPTWYTRTITALLQTGLTQQAFTCPAVVHHRIATLSKQQRPTIEKEITRFLKHFPKHPEDGHTLKRTEYLLRKLNYPTCYMLWTNPRRPKYNEKPEYPDKNRTPENRKTLTLDQTNTPIQRHKSTPNRIPNDHPPTSNQPQIPIVTR